MQFPSFVKKTMDQIKSFLIPLLFIISLVVIIASFQLVAFNESVLLKELGKAVPVVALLGLLKLISNNSTNKNNTYENY